ncbi:MAG TPA: DUF6624 domain-containing protein [Streptomyces sp.]
MTTPPQRPDLARDLTGRARQARDHHAKHAHGLLSAFEADLGRHLDQANTQILQRIVRQHGWPGRSLVGEEAAEAALSLALHAGRAPDVQQEFLRQLATAVEQGEAPVRHWAHLLDRCAVNAGDPQVYGTQYRLSPDGVQMLPVREPEHLDARRARAGLPPHAPVQEALRQRHSRARESAPAPCPERGEEPSHLSRSAA